MTHGRMMTKLVLVGAMVLATGTTVTAQETAPSINTGAVSFSVGADIPTAYVFRGYEIEDSGLIVQPYAEATFAVADGVDFYLGTWNSLHSNHTGAGGTAGGNSDVWFESDFYTGVSLANFDPVSVDLSYVSYMYPGNATGAYQEIDVTVGYDDSELLGEWSMNPYALVAFEFATGGAGDTDDTYLELGGEWSYSLVDSADYPIDLTVPVKIGLSLDGFYVDSTGGNETFGFVSIGANLGMPLTCIPTEFGTWSAGAGVTVYFENDDVALNDSSDDVLIVGTLGVSMEY